MRREYIHKKRQGGRFGESPKRLQEKIRLEESTNAQSEKRGNEGLGGVTLLWENIQNRAMDLFSQRFAKT